MPDKGTQMREKGYLMTGTHFMMGNLACAERALAAGCRFVAGYPITPANEIVNHLARKLPRAGGVLLQTEDEISAICTAIGASHGRVSSTKNVSYATMR
jgi:2-oxoglutarate ferredoxin oxidoreductase subunit alpha